MTGYLMEMSTAGQMAAEDPFGGSGVFLPLAADAGSILEALDRAFGMVQAVAWPGHGAWVDAAAAGVPRDELLTRWGTA